MLVAAVGIEPQTFSVRILYVNIYMKMVALTSLQLSSYVKFSQ